jgi:[acyl-carrier-protein] S-malonyltransferase
MADQGVTEAWDIGAGKALSGMIKRISKDVATNNVGTPDDVAAAVEALKG